MGSSPNQFLTLRLLSLPFHFSEALTFSTSLLYGSYQLLFKLSHLRANLFRLDSTFRSSILFHVYPAHSYPYLSVLVLHNSVPFRLISVDMLSISLLVRSLQFLSYPNHLHHFVSRRFGSIPYRIS